VTTSTLIENRRRGLRGRVLPFATMATVLVGAVTFGAAAAPASSGKAALIASPRSNQSVKGTIHIRPRVTSRKGPYKVRVWVDGKLYNVDTAKTRGAAQSKVPIDTRELSNGRHKLKVQVNAKSSPRKAAQQIRFVVRNAGGAPSGAGRQAPARNMKNYRLLLAENFDRPAPLGSMVNNDSPDTPVYEGSSGAKWLTYPTFYLDTFLRHPYRADQVLSVHDNVLDFWLHRVDGLTAGASISPLIDGIQQYQTYGRYSVRMRLGNAAVSDFHAAFLLWPRENEDYEFSESDFPEMQLARGMEQVTGYAHYGRQSAQEYIFTDPLDLRDWHTYTQEWSPNQRKFYLDDKLIYTTHGPVWAGPQRWQLQVQSFHNGNQSGHLYIDWAAAWAWAPGTPAG
jgi:hypothetical protein